MPQVVACGQCRQQFAAADFLVGTTVACPTCGAALAIPRPVQATYAPVGSVAALPPTHPAAPAAPPKSLGALIDDLARLLPPQFRRRDRAIGLAILVAVAVIWLAAVLPSLRGFLWWAGQGFRNNVGPIGQMFARVGALSVVFWVGMLAAGAGIFEWSWWMNSYKMQVTREWFGQRGARWFLVGVGGVIAAMSLAFIVGPLMLGWAMWARHAAAGPAVPRPWAAPPAPPRAVVAEKAPANIPRADLPQQPLASGGVLPIADAAAGQDPANLPGSWRRLEGGLGIKVPDVLIVEKETVRRARGVVRQELHGRTQAGKDGVTFHLVLELAPGNNHQSSGQAVLANGLVLHRTSAIAGATETYNDETFTHRGIRHQHSQGPIQVTIDVGSRFEPDHAEVQALAAYALTLQPLAPAAGQEPGTMSSGQWQGRWRALPGGLCILVPSSLFIEEDTFEQPTIFGGNTSQTINGTTITGIEYRLTARYSPRDKFPNTANQMRVHTADTDIEPVTLDGLVFSRTSRVTDRQSEVSYQLLDGPYNITLRIVSRAGDPRPGGSRGPPTGEFRTLAAYAETIQRAP